MSYYRLYLLDKDGSFKGCVAMECRNDAEAIAFTADRLKNQPAELWNNSRHVAVIGNDGAIEMIWSLDETKEQESRPEQEGAPV